MSQNQNNNENNLTFEERKIIINFFIKKQIQKKIMKIMKIIIMKI